LNNVLEEIRQKLSHQDDINKINNFINSLFYYKIPLDLNFIAINKNYFNDDEETKRNINYEITLNPKNAKETNLSKYHQEISTLESTTCYQDASNTIRELLDNSNSSSLVPFIYKNNVIGFALVSQREKNHYFTNEDVLVFDNLSYHIGLALEQINANNKLQNLEVVKKQSHEYKILAGSIAYEVRNPLNSINLLGTQIKTILHNNDDDLFNSPNFDILQQAAKQSPNPSKTNAELSNVLLKYRRNKMALSDLTSKISDSIYSANNIINIILGDLKDHAINPEDLEFINLPHLIPDIIDKYGYKSDIAKQAVTIDYESFKNDRGRQKDIYIKAVKERLTFTIYNILKNALIYINEYQNLKIEISISEEMSKPQNINNQDAKEQKYIVINVTDYNGPGISKENIDKIFEDFFTTKKSNQGSGLGLAFCQRNMKLFGGHIKCASKLNEYTKFSLYFPKPTKQEIDNIDNYKKQKILVIDQDKKFIKTIEEHLDITCQESSVQDPNLGNLIFKNSYKLIIFNAAQNLEAKEEELLIKHLKSSRNINKQCGIIAHTNYSFEKLKKSYKSLINYYINHHDDQSCNILLRTISKLTATDPSKEIDLSYIKQEKIDLAQYKMIFADDNEINLRVTKNALESLGLSVTAAIDGRELIDIFKKDLETQIKDGKEKSSFNLILTDINMPYIEGNKAAKEIRKIEEKNKIKYQNQIPIISITGNIVNADKYYYEDESENIFNLFQTGFNDYFLKGNDPENLIKLIKVYLK
ncbi:MAG: hybrid sensor histidine kinase/response regulator, partial [Rickettsiales bacterium]|nr:hybrid sensor histidine kinase/response regulator [Rickettsiales bacterium]